MISGTQNWTLRGYIAYTVYQSRSVSMFVFIVADLMMSFSNTVKSCETVVGILGFTRIYWLTETMIFSNKCKWKEEIESLTFTLPKHTATVLHQKQRWCVDQRFQHIPQSKCWRCRRSSAVRSHSSEYRRGGKKQGFLNLKQCWGHEDGMLFIATDFLFKRALLLCFLSCFGCCLYIFGNLPLSYSTVHSPNKRK